MRSSILDGQIQAEASNRGSLAGATDRPPVPKRRSALQIDRMASGAEGTAAQGVGAGTAGGTASEMFNAFQSLSTNPTSMAERQTLLMKAASLAMQFNQLDTRLDNLPVR